ncbi:MAG: dienelactone hydrolase family protein, partial [Bacteroidota bacterium]
MKHVCTLFMISLCFVACGEPATTNDAAAETTPETTVAESTTVEFTAQDMAFNEATPEVTGQEVTYKTETTTMNGYLAYDENQTGKRPGVLVIHEWWGHNDYARKRAEMLADLGYVALAVDMYGDGKKASHPEDAGKFSGAVFANMDEAKLRFEAALATLKSNELVDGEKMAAIGYCFGGSVALTMANAGYDLDAVAAFHSGVQLPIMPPSEGTLDTKVLVANGAADPFIPLESVVAWTKAMEAI